MSDINRAHFDTIGDKKSSNITKSVKTMRFELNLFEPNVDSFPQFNYSTLARMEKKKKKLVQNGTSAPFEENDDDVARIAKELEKKYGNAYTGCGIGARSMHNAYDKGSGYDENDGFIDNTEAYDELMPDEVDTDRGGFYINSGALAFKQVPNFERPEDALRMPKPKKRAISSSESESDDDSDDSADVEEEEASSSTKLKNGHVEKKLKTSNDKEKVVTNKEVKKIEQTKAKDKNDRAGSDSGKEGSAQKLIKTMTVKDLLRTQRDNARANNDDKSDKTTTEASSSESSTDSSDVGDRAKERDSEKRDEVTDSIAIETGTEEKAAKNEGETNGIGPETVPAEVKLPDNLPSDLLALIEQIKEACRLPTSKINFFNAETMNIIYSIDICARELQQSAARHQIFNHLEKYLPCTKQTIMGRIKKHRIEKEEQKVIKILSTLEEAVKLAMPPVQDEHKTRTDRLRQDYEKRKLSGEKIETQFRSPRKKFPWTDTIRSLVSNIIKIKEESYAVIQPRRQTMDEFIDTYLEEKIVPMWPTGWMRKDELRSECDKSKNKKPKERKKSIESSNASLNNSKKDKNTHQTKDSVTSAATISTFGTTVTAVNAVNAVTAAATSITTNINNNNTVNILQSTSPPKAIVSSTSNTSTLIANTSKTDSHSLPLNFGSSSLTITAVDTTDMTTSKPLPSVPNKVTITNIDAANALATSASLQRNITPPSVSIHATNGGHPIYNSPTKLASDHSIHHLISSPQIIHSTDSDSSPVQLTTSRTYKDGTKQVAAVLSKAAELKKITAVKTSGKESPIQITSVQSMPANISAGKPQRSDTIDINDSTSDDDVEFVETPNAVLSLRDNKLIGSPSERNDRGKCVTVNKLKYKSAIDSTIRGSNSRSDSPKTMGIIKAEATVKDNDVDVIKIMKQLKELQEMQSSNASVSYSKFSNSNLQNHHSTSYNNKN